MSSMTGNPHVQGRNDRNTHTNEGLIEATLALAYEQRTANLIAITSVFRASYEKGQLHSAAVQELIRLAEEINSRLGIKA